MANQLATNPWRVDTTGSATLGSGGMAKVGQIEFIDYASSTDHVEIQDRNGRIVARLGGDSSLKTVRTGKIGWVQGLIVPVTDSDGNPNMATGKILIYFE